MTDLSSKPFSTLPSRALAVLALGLSLAACGKDDSAPAAVAKVDACALVDAAMVAKLAPGLGKGHPSSAAHPAGVSTCVWNDSAHHLPALMLTVAPADPSGVAKGLKQGLGKMGYRVVSVSGLGDEAATAIQQADPKHGLAAGVATLDVRVGKRQLGFSPMRLAISGPGTPAFERLKRFAADAVARLGTGHKG